MGIFSKKEEKQLTLWEQYWKQKEQLEHIKKAMQEIESELVSIANFEGKTAYFEGGNKIRKKENIKLTKPNGFDKSVFLAENAEFAKIELDEAKLKKVIEKNGNIFEDDFGLEYSETYTFERS